MGSLLHNHRGTAIAGRVAALCRAGHAEGRARLGITGDIGGVHLRQTLAGMLWGRGGRGAQKGHNFWG